MTLSGKVRHSGLDPVSIFNVNMDSGVGQDDAGGSRQHAARSPSTYAPAPVHRFDIGDAVLVKRRFPPGHRRTPCYIRGKRGVIERICGAFPNPEELAYGFDGEPKRVLYRVRFEQKDVWPGYSGAVRDIIEMEIFEHWLEPA